MPRTPGSLADVRGVAVGQADDPALGSGVTVARFDEAVPTVVDVRGGASATYDTASLSLDATFGRRWAIFFSGGSVYGLDAARGVRARILESGGGHRAFRNPTRIVPLSGAALFDLPSDGGPVPEYLALGYEAARRASPGPVVVGRVGAGRGATVGKYLGRSHAMNGGVGTAAARWRARSTVGVLVVVNSVGGVRDPVSGRWVAGARGPRGRIVPPNDGSGRRGHAEGTTLALVATDLAVERSSLARIASIVHAGLARAIVPYQTATDGDAVFAVATGKLGPPPSEPWPGGTADRIGRIAADCAVEAVLRAVRVSNRRA